jgi:hypothetical protein
MSRVRPDKVLAVHRRLGGMNAGPGSASSLYVLANALPHALAAGDDVRAESLAVDLEPLMRRLEAVGVPSIREAVRQLQAAACVARRRDWPRADDVRTCAVFWKRHAHRVERAGASQVTSVFAQLAHEVHSGHAVRRGWNELRPARRNIDWWDSAGAIDAPSDVVVCVGHRHDIRGAMTVDPETVLTWDWLSTLCWWNRSGQLVRRIDCCPGEAVIDVQLHRGRIIVTSNVLGAVTVWSRDGERVAALDPLEPSQLHVRTVPHGDDGILRVFKDGRDHGVQLDRPGHGDATRLDAVDVCVVADAMVLLSPGGRSVVAGASVLPLRRPATRLERLEERRVVALDDDGSVAVIGVTDHGLVELERHDVEGFSYPIRALAMPGDRVLYWHEITDRFELWGGGHRLAAGELPGPNRPRVVPFDERTVAIAGASMGTGLYWFDVVSSVRDFAAPWPNVARLAPDLNASWKDDGHEVFLWTHRTWSGLGAERTRHPDRITDVLLLSTGTVATLSGLIPSLLVVWDPQTGRPLLEVDVGMHAKGLLEVVPGVVATSRFPDEAVVCVDTRLREIVGLVCERLPTTGPLELSDVDTYGLVATGSRFKYRYFQGSVGKVIVRPSEGPEGFPSLAELSAFAVSHPATAADKHRAIGALRAAPWFPDDDAIEPRCLLPDGTVVATTVSGSVVFLKRGSAASHQTPSSGEDDAIPPPEPFARDSAAAADTGPDDAIESLARDDAKRMVAALMNSLAEPHDGRQRGELIAAFREAFAFSLAAASGDSTGQSHPERTQGSGEGAPRIQDSAARGLP